MKYNRTRVSDYSTSLISRDMGRYSKDFRELPGTRNYKYQNKHFFK